LHAPAPGLVMIADELIISSTIFVRQCTRSISPIRPGPEPSNGSAQFFDQRSSDARPRLMRIRYLRSILLSTLIGIWAGPQAAHAATLRIGVYDQPPDIYIAPDGQPSGILGEILNEIAKREGWTLTL